MSHLTIANQLALAPKADEIINILDKLSKKGRSLLVSLADLRPDGRPDVQHAWKHGARSREVRSLVRLLSGLNGEK